MKVDKTLLTKNKPKVNNSNIDAIERACLSGNYPSEEGGDKQPKENISNENYLQLPSRKVAVSTITIDPDKVALWAGNPRNFAISVDTSDLEPLIAKGKGNTTPVLARKLQVPNREGQNYEIIAGLRRKLTCSKLQFKLTLNVVDIDDDEALYLTEMENEGRKENDLFAECRYLKYRFDRMKALNSSITIEDFADSQLKPVKRQTMNEKLRLASVPEEVLISVKDPHSWTFRKAVKLKGYINTLGLSEVIKSIESRTFSNADQLLAYLKDNFDVTKKAEPENYKVGKGEVVIKKTTKTTVITIDNKVSEALKSKIELLIKEASN